MIVLSKIKLKWRVRDGNACPICKAIDGYEWEFNAGIDSEVPEILFHPEFGIVWSLSLGSNAHSQHGYLSGGPNNCRCTMEENFDLEDVLAKSVFIVEELKSMVENIAEPHDMKRGSYRRTTPADIGVDLSKYGIT